MSLAQRAQHLKHRRSPRLSMVCQALSSLGETCHDFVRKRGARIALISLVHGAVPDWPDLSLLLPKSPAPSLSWKYRTDSLSL